MTPITQYFHCRISKYYQNKDVCKKLELKILKFGQMADIFVRTKILRFKNKCLKIKFLGRFSKLF